MSAFWDTSAILPLVVDEPATTYMLGLLRDDQGLIVWWGTRIECASAIARRMREGRLDVSGQRAVRTSLDLLSSSWSEVQPTVRVRTVAERLLSLHDLRAADALQLSSAPVWSDGTPGGRPFICLDDRLRTAALREGFTIQPAENLRRKQ